MVEGARRQRSGNNPVMAAEEETEQTVIIGRISQTASRAAFPETKCTYYPADTLGNWFFNANHRGNLRNS